MSILIWKTVYGHNRRILCCIASIILAVTALGIWVGRGSVLIEDMRPEAAAIYDQLYYMGKDYREEKANFIIEKYEMNFTVWNELESDVRMVVSDIKDSDEYIFTLYHRFGIDSVRDDKGQEIPFEQNGDWFRIQKDDMPANYAIRISYSGWSPKYYSNAQGISMPGYFPYYPMAGIDLILEIPSP